MIRQIIRLAMCSLGVAIGLSLPLPTCSSADEAQLINRLKELGARYQLDQQRQMRSIDFTRTKADDATIEMLAGQTSLRSLNLTGAKITDRALKTVAGLSNLTSVALTATDVSDEGLKLLMTLPLESQLTDALQVELMRWGGVMVTVTIQLLLPVTLTVVL